MLNKGRELLKTQEDARVALAVEEKARIEKEVIDFQELAKMLGCEFLLEGMNTGNKVITKEVEVIKEVPTNTTELEEEIATSSKTIKDLEEKVKDLTQASRKDQGTIKKLQNNLEALKDKVVKRGYTAISNKELKKLQSDVAKFEKQAKDWRDKYNLAVNKSEDTSKSELDEYKKQIQELQDKLNNLTKTNTDLNDKLSAATKEAETHKKSMSTWQRKYTELFNSVKANKDNGADNKSQNTTKEDPKVEENKPVIDNSNKNDNKKDKPSNNGPQRKVGTVSDLVRCVNYKNRRDDVTLYDGGSYYVMASALCQQITVIPGSPKLVVTPEVEQAYQNKLVAMGYNAQRTNVSPVVVHSVLGNNKFGYLARTEGKNGTDVFTNGDVFAGYVYIDKTCYLYTWNRENHPNPVVYHFDAMVNGEKDFVHDYEKSLVSGLVKLMYKEYAEKIEEYKKVANQQALENTRKSEEYKEQREKESQMFNSQVSNSIKNGNVIGDTGAIDNSKPSSGRRSRRSRTANNNQGGGTGERISSTLENASQMW